MNPLSHYSQEAMSANDDVVAELLEALQDLLRTTGEAAGLTMSVVADPEQFENFLVECERRVEAANDKARALLTRYAHLRRKA